MSSNIRCVRWRRVFRCKTGSGEIVVSDSPRDLGDGCSVSKSCRKCQGFCLGGLVFGFLLAQARWYQTLNITFSPSFLFSTFNSVLNTIKRNHTSNGTSTSLFYCLANVDNVIIKFCAQRTKQRKANVDDIYIYLFILGLKMSSNS